MDQWIAISPICVNLVNFGPVTLEFKRVVGVHFLIYEINLLRQIISGSSWRIFTKCFNTW